MKKVKEKTDELKPEYDLTKLRVRRVGPARKRFGAPLIRLETDVAEVFPDAESVNEALRFLFRVTKQTGQLRPKITKNSGAFSILELILVIVVIAILVAIVDPNFLEASTRSDVSKRQNDLRVIALAMETYRVEHNAYPPSDKDSSLAGHGTRNDIDQRLLTTPVGYMPVIIEDIFRKTAQRKNHRGGSSRYEIYTVHGSSNPFVERLAEPDLSAYPRTGWMTWSIGPDLQSNTEGYRSFKSVLANEASADPAIDAAGMRFDPTNGSVSVGDIYRFEGDARSED